MSPAAVALPASFHEAVASFRSFLRTNGRPDAIVWVTPEDVVAVKSRLHVFVRSPNRRWMDAQVRYELGIDRRMGVLLYQICEAPGLSCCQVYIPKNQGDAAQRDLDNDLKLSFSPEVRPAVAVTNRLRWAWLKMVGKRDSVDSF